MSVAIAAPQAKLPAPTAASASAPATSTDSTVSTDSTAASGADFASLLLGQLAAGADLQAVVPESQPAPPDSNSITSMEAPPQDPALLLAALGLAPQLPPAPKTDDVQLTGKADNTLLPSIGEKQTVTALKNTPLDALKDGQKSEALGNSSTFTLPTTGIEGDPAKVAVSEIALPKAEVLPVSHHADEGLTNGTTGIASHTPVSTPRNEAPLKVETPVRDQNWAADFSQKVVWLANNDKQFAQMTLNPPQMGPIEISLNINKDGASAFFVSQNADVREAIETALPRLREMLAGVGIELGQANVGAESFRQPAGSDDSRQGSPRWMADNAILGGDSMHSLSGQAIVAQRGNGMVDIFA